MPVPIDNSSRNLQEVPESLEDLEQHAEESPTHQSAESSSLQLSLASSAISSRVEQLSSLVLGMENSDFSSLRDVPIFSAIYESSTHTPVPTPLVGVGYINGSQSGYYDTQRESLHLSQLLGSRRVEVVYNQGNFMEASLLNLCPRRPRRDPSPISLALLELWEAFFLEHPPGSTFNPIFFW